MTQQPAVFDFDFTDDSAVGRSVLDQDVLRLKRDESARFTMIDKQARGAWTHYLQNQGRSSSSGESYGSYFLCFGRPDVINVNPEVGDPQNCVFCAAIDNINVAAPRRRFVAHVARFRTNQRGDIVTPASYAMELIIFGDDKFRKFATRAKERGDLRAFDFVIKCTGERFQNWDMDVVPALMLRQDRPDGAALLQQYKALASQVFPDAIRRIGRSVSVEEALKCINLAKGGGGSTLRDVEAVTSVADLLGDDTSANPAVLDIDALLSQKAAAAAAPLSSEALAAVTGTTTAAAPSLNVSVDQGALSVAAAIQQEAPAPAPVPVAEPPVYAPAAAAFDLDSLLKS